MPFGRYRRRSGGFRRRGGRRRFMKGRMRRRGRKVLRQRIGIRL